VLSVFGTLTLLKKLNFIFTRLLRSFVELWFACGKQFSLETGSLTQL
jgi:hypothetical protein